MPDDQQTTPRPLGAPAAREAAAAAAEQDRLRAEAKAAEEALTGAGDIDASVSAAVDAAIIDDLAAGDAAFDAHKTPPPLVPEADKPAEPIKPESAGEPDPPADEEAARPNLAGKRVVLYAKTGVAGWIALNGPHGPLLYDGDRDTAVTAALDDERNTKLADMVRNDPERFLLVSVPASSWAPAPVKPKVTKTTWTVVR